jgi:hypothetical protein
MSSVGVLVRVLVFGAQRTVDVWDAAKETRSTTILPLWVLSPVAVVVVQGWWWSLHWWLEWMAVQWW